MTRNAESVWSNSHRQMMQDGLIDLITGFDTVSLSDTKAFQLFNRVDVKYLTTIETVLDCLPHLQSHYQIVTANGSKLVDYRTIYFDSPELKMYHDHHNGRKSRYKIRYREYAQTGDRFLEIKHKQAGVTHKKRVAVDRFSLPLNGGTREFIESNTPYEVTQLKPVVRTEFIRLTLINKMVCERITIDLGVMFDEFGHHYEMPNLAIVEIKKQRDGHCSVLSDCLKERLVRPVSISKYCVGIAKLYPHIKYNQFKSVMRLIEKYHGEERYTLLKEARS
jgi:hypothetical protein